MTAPPHPPPRSASSARAPRRPGRALLTWGAPLLAVGLVVLTVLAANVRDRASALRLAAAELRARLDPGERVQHQTRTVERHWYDLYRATYGALAATDRRVLYVGVLPELYPSADAPRAYDVRSYPYDTLFSIAMADAGRGSAAVVVRHGRSARRYRVPASQRADLAALVREAFRRDNALREALRREKQWRDSLAALPPIREYYRVQPGDALEAIARRFATTTERLRALNHLESDRIRVGEQLLVRETPHPVTPCPPEVCGTITSSEGALQLPAARTLNPPPR
ncbi:MAG TPA: LysM peptidoglycan-binding domain-containing protein [Gemmatimonadaceae bacterium]|nr:LysM peptidoglycan-binding domain-containing protein [Gemmatimonadaceae bacterium]